MATNAKLPPPTSSNHVITGPPKGVVGGNRKKQKRRAKQAARSASHPHGPPPGGQPGDEYDEDPLGYGDEDEYDYSDAEGYNDHFIPPHAGPNGYNMPPPATGSNKKQKKKGSTDHAHSVYNPELLANTAPPMPGPPPLPMSMTHRGSHKNIWNTSSQQERQNIKDFWLSLSEDERKSLLKIEKEAVLRKMKQQQKHSCSCTVCGRKRTAIEEELEVLYEGYYEELEQYAHHDHPPLPSADGMMPDPLQHRGPHPLAAPPPHTHPHPHPHPHHRTSQLQEHFDEDEEEYSDEEEEEYSDEDYSDDEPEALARNGVPDFFNFGQNLTVKGILTPWLEKLQNGLKGNADNLLTVADDLLKNDGRKFIEMMEQLAERRMARENEAEYAAANPSHPGGYPPGDPGYNHEDPLAAGDEYDDDEASYDSQEDYDDDMDDEDEMTGLSEEQRVQEGRRMFQIFAARMFEQRVLTAYKEKVAHERQQKLLEELEDETKLEAQREAKKQREAQKKKEKKKQQAQAKAEEKAKREAEKAAEEARVREAEEKKQEEQRRKKEEQRKKKEEEKRKQDEERAKKEADKARRLQEEQQRREDAERKARESKAAEKAKKDEARKREKEEREAREKEARDRKALEEKEKKEREAKAKAEKEAKEREKSAQQAAQPPTQQQVPQIAKRPSMVAIPGVHPKPTNSAISSPHPSIATPAIPKAPTPAKQRQASHQGSLASSPKQMHSQVSSLPSKSSSPNSSGSQQQSQQQPIGPPKAIVQKAGNQQAGPQSLNSMHTASPLHQQPMQPPPGMSHPQHPPGGFGGMPPMGFGGFQGPQGPMMHGNMGNRGPMPMYPQHGGPPMGAPNNRFGLPGMNGLPGPPPGMMMPQGRGMNFPFDASATGQQQPPPGFGPPQTPQIPNQTAPIGQPPVSAAPGGEISRSAHSRQHSASEKERFESAANQPIARPAPIQRPSSVKPQSQERRGSNTDVDDLSKHLGSSALLDDSDEPMPTNPNENRRASTLQAGPRNPQAPGIGPLGGGFGGPTGGFGGPGWNPPGLAPFGQSPALGQQNWGAPLPSPGMSGWANNNAAFAANSAFGPIGGSQIHRPPGAGVNRPLTIRLAVCQACKQLTNSNRGEGDGFHGIDLLLRQIESNRPPLDSAPTLREIEEICETEGDSQNGGGELQVHKEGAGGDKFAVKWAPDAATPDQGRGGLSGLGEIGSPMPNKVSPSGFGAPGMGRAPGPPGGFGSLGAVGSSAPSGF
ncbi:Stress response protein nst1 [Vermiconidia calcicola]|uniref:Stress response protein nst1 n=1 Tax=Vermiconidia calcicola TaxID=1690605 RepID=A0ACC3MAY4_9PEZI|nr:Stress response protein nst1 [Vermiconidia calcicola]